ncbi:hypothetical protein QP185_18250 [Sphingomonas aerolata]|uniref:hypothetical protein n=1 Tax=Sphingomonas aerolata TaxID=185951 RepID=UPI002FE3BE34
MGDGNVAQGDQAGMYWTGSNRYFVANNPDEELIGGDFALRTAHVNGTLTAEGFYRNRITPSRSAPGRGASPISMPRRA